MNSDGGDLDPVSYFLADPQSHLSDILYLNFRAYKRSLVWSFFSRALSQLTLPQTASLSIADIGASSAFDLLYLFRMLTSNFIKPIAFQQVHAHLVEGDPKLIEGGKQLLSTCLTDPKINFTYYNTPLVKGLPLQTGGQHVVICSEVVEHLEDPASLIAEMFRILVPGGFLIFTTDNSPSLLQRIRRLPVWLKGRYQEAYKAPIKEEHIHITQEYQGESLPIYGHINLNPTSYWEKLCINAGFVINAYGTYESIRRGGGSKSPAALAAYFLFGAIVYYLMPARLGRYFGDTTALLLRKGASCGRPD